MGRLPARGVFPCNCRLPGIIVNRLSGKRISRRKLHSGPQPYLADPDLRNPDLLVEDLPYHNWTVSGNNRGTFGTHSGQVPDTYRTGSGHIHDRFATNSGQVRDTFRTGLVQIQDRTGSGHHSIPPRRIIILNSIKQVSS